MRVICSKHDNFIFEKPTGVGLGNFDGLHIGHMALINAVINESKLNGLKSIVYTFEKHPENILRKKLITPLLTTVRKKISLLNETSLDYLYFDRFDEEFSRMNPEDFAREILVDRLNIKLAVAGYNYRFGYKGLGDIELLKNLGALYGFKVIIIPPIKVGDEVVSSTLIRHEVANGNMDKVFKFLGRHYSITGQVQSGRRIGNKLGFPTANIHPEEYLVLPSFGVYVTKTLLDGRMYNSITNIGINPTFENIRKPVVETHILDFDNDLYGKDIEVYFLHRLRGEMKFNNVDELASQIGEDIVKAREILNISG